MGICQFVEFGESAPMSVSIVEYLAVALILTLRQPPLPLFPPIASYLHCLGSQRTYSIEHDGHPYQEPEPKSNDACYQAGHSQSVAG